MKKMMVWVITLVALSTGVLRAQDIAGSWQGTLQAGKGLRTILKVSKAESGDGAHSFTASTRRRTVCP